MGDPDIASNPSEFQKVATAAAEIEPIVEAHRQLMEADKELQGARTVLKESAGASMAVRAAPRLPVSSCSLGELREVH